MCRWKFITHLFQKLLVMFFRDIEFFKSVALISVLVSNTNRLLVITQNILKNISRESPSSICVPISSRNYLNSSGESRMSSLAKITLVICVILSFYCWEDKRHFFAVSGVTSITIRSIVK